MVPKKPLRNDHKANRANAHDMIATEEDGIWVMSEQQQSDLHLKENCLGYYPHKRMA